MVSDRQTETVGVTDAAAPPASRAGVRRTRERRGTGGSALAVVVLSLAIGLATWAPWRDAGPPTLSAYTPRTGMGTVTTAELAPVPASPPAATASTPATDTSRPVGLPLQRNDWVILRDWAAHGGPGANGAVDIGLLDNRDALGTPVYATHDGSVRVLRGNALYGNLVAVKNNRWSTTYGHLQQVHVTDGQMVRRGDLIGTMGATGRATSPQLDYQVWETVGGRELNRNPMDFITPR